MDRLKREGNPPAGQLASPKPQYKDVQTNDWEELKGEGGASYVKDKDALAKLEQARLLLASIDGKDFATDAKLGDLQTLLGSLDGKDFATQTTLAQVKTELDLVKTELETIKANQLSGDQKVQLSGTKVVESAPVTGIKTVTSTVAEVFAGSSRKANRSKLVIRNLHQAVAIRIGGSGITDTIGQSLEPGASVEIDFSPSTTVPIYAVSTAGNVSVEVLEV